MNKEELQNLYLDQKKSAAEIGIKYKVSVSKVNYWLAKYSIPKRSISDGVYQKWNPNGDPFNYKEPKNFRDFFIFGLGLGLFWGEGNKRNKHSVKLGNTDPKLIKAFIVFLENIFGVERSKFRFGLQVFNDSNPKEAFNFWSKELGFPKNHFLPKVVVSKVRGEGTYKNKSKYGVLTVYVNNKKLKEQMTALIENIRQIGYYSDTLNVQQKPL